jgi:hypothetical protein
MIRRKLISRIRITLDPQKKRKSSEQKIRYYEKYAFLVSKALKEPLFQKFLHRIIKNENIEIDKIRDIRIKTFPLKKENGNRLAGKCNNKGVICLYPKGISVYHKLMLNWKRDRVNFYVKCRARAALIHEVLHIKYLSQEVKVRTLTRKYFKTFIRLTNPDTNHQTIFQKLFPKTTSEQESTAALTKIR